MKKTIAMIALPALVLAGCSKKTPIKAIKAAPTHVESTVSTVTSGTVDAEQQAVLGFSTAGRVSRVSVKLGDRVRQGQVLAELENTDLRTTDADAQSELQRAEELFKQGLVSKAALDDAKRSYEVARSSYARSVIRAPFDGMVTELNLQLGELTSANAAKPPMRLVDLKPRIVKGDIDEIDLAKVRVGQAARIKVLAVRPEPFKAEVTKVVPFVGTTREQDRSAHIELKFSEPTDFVPVGASSDIEIIVAAKDDGLSVPSRAVLGSGGERYVFRVDGGKLQKTPVKLGIGNYDRSEIAAGLKAGEIVVLPSDDAELKDGKKMKVAVQPWP